MSKKPTGDRKEKKGKEKGKNEIKIGNGRKGVKEMNRKKKVQK